MLYVESVFIGHNVIRFFLFFFFSNYSNEMTYIAKAVYHFIIFRKKGGANRNEKKRTENTTKNSDCMHLAGNPIVHSLSHTCAPYCVRCAMCTKCDCISRSRLAVPSGSAKTCTLTHTQRERESGTRPNTWLNMLFRFHFHANEQMRSADYVVVFGKRRNHSGRPVCQCLRVSLLQYFKTPQ